MSAGGELKTLTSDKEDTEERTLFCELQHLPDVECSSKDKEGLEDFPIVDEAQQHTKVIFDNKQQEEIGTQERKSEVDEELLLLEKSSDSSMSPCTVSDKISESSMDQNTLKDNEESLCLSSTNDISKHSAQRVLFNPGNVQMEALTVCDSYKDTEPPCEGSSKCHFFDKETDDVLAQFSNPQKTPGEEKNENQIFCDPCLCGNIQTEATSFCKTCEDLELLCEGCSKQHTRQKATKDHEICKDIKQYLTLQESHQGRNDQSKKQTLCDPCLYGNIQTEATSFCRTCDDPEPLCDDCAKQHIRQKATKGHEICNDIHQYHTLQEKFHQGKNETKILCDPCLCGNIQTEATSFCRTCEDPEPLCDYCAKQHTRQKPSKSHEICSDIKQYHTFQEVLHQGQNDQLQKQILCDPCLCGNIQTEATSFCRTCKDPEPLCDNCAMQHTRQKATKSHEVCSDMEQYPALQELLYQGRNDKQKKKIFCDPCLCGNIKKVASRFCRTCEDPEPLCEDCAKQHTRQKATKSHEICHDMEQYSSLQDVLYEGEHKKREKQVFCDPCLRGTIEVEATSFCRTCQDPEPLCDDCATQHTRQKATKSHEVCKDMEQYPYFIRVLYERCSRKKSASTDEKVPGKPHAKEIYSDCIGLLWEKPLRNVDSYQLRFKLGNEDSKWKFADVNFKENYALITGLMAHSEYIFQVRALFQEQEGPYGPFSDVIKTKQSSATTFLKFCVRQNDVSPPKYLLPIEENELARNKAARTRQLILGTPVQGYSNEKTIMLVGATGSGKSTLVDGLVNYIMGVSFEDPFRFTVVTLEEEEKKNDNQALSQTEWITVYKIYPSEGSRLNYTLNIIDTPGFGDTRGIARDNAIVDQIRHLFSAQGDQGVLFIDAVCFLVKAPDARLTIVQKYIFSSIMSLFGKDIESNICTLITFADGARPPVLASLKESGLPFGQTFNFNNSALFAENRDGDQNTLSPMFWNMGCDSFKRLFLHIIDLETKSLCQTKDVLEEREQLKIIITHIRPQVTAALSKLSELKQQLFIFERYKNEINDNQNFEYTVQETRQEVRDLPKGQYVTNCVECNTTCHEKCKIADDDQKMRCWAMDKKTGKCKICVEKCRWSLHKNTPYIFEYITEPVKKTYAEMKERYEKALGETLTHEKYIEQLTDDVDDLFDETMSMMNEMNQCKTRLKEIALRPDPLSMVEHIDLLIQSENTEKQSGYFERIQMLKELKRMALVDQDVQKLGKNIQDARNNAQSVVGRPLRKKIRVQKGRKKNIFRRGFQYVKERFYEFGIGMNIPESSERRHQVREKNNK